MAYRKRKKPVVFQGSEVADRVLFAEGREGGELHEQFLLSDYYQSDEVQVLAYDNKTGSEVSLFLEEDDIRCLKQAVDKICEKRGIKTDG